MNQSIDFREFIRVYKEFNSIRTWTKRKYELKESILELIQNQNTIQLYIHCHSINCITLGSNYFLIIKINSERKGFLKQFRDKWIFVYSQRERYKMKYIINVLSDDFNSKSISDLGKVLNLDLSNQIIEKDSFNRRH